MVKLEARKENGEIIISEDSFEHLLNCLDNQKFIHDVNADGMSLGIKKVREIQAKNQAYIDDFSRQCRKLLQGTDKEIPLAGMDNDPQDGPEYGKR